MKTIITQSFKKHKDSIPGGRADNRDPKGFDQKQIQMGIKIEQEHCKGNLQLAKEIAMDHLTEDPHYYTKLNDAGL